MIHEPACAAAVRRATRRPVRMSSPGGSAGRNAIHVTEMIGGEQVALVHAFYEGSVEVPTEASA